MRVPDGMAFPSNGQTLFGTVVDVSNVHWEDVFYLREDFVTRLQGSVDGTSLFSTTPGSPIAVRIDSTAQRNPELTAADRLLPNPIAQPEILVGRVDAYGIAFDPVGADVNGRTPIGPDGKPQEVSYWALNWQRNPTLEQRLIIDFFDRDHSHRVGAEPWGNYRTAALRQPNSGLTSPSAFNTLLRGADPTGFAPSVAVEGTLTDYVRWLKTPAVLRGIASHSDGLPSQAHRLDGRRRGRGDRDARRRRRAGAGAAGAALHRRCARGDARRVPRAVRVRLERGGAGGRRLHRRRHPRLGDPGVAGGAARHRRRAYPQQGGQLSTQGAIGNLFSQLAPTLGQGLGTMFGQGQLGSTIGNVASQLGRFLPFGVGPEQMGQQQQQPYGQWQQPQVSPQGIGSLLGQFAPHIGHGVSSWLGMPQLGSTIATTLPQISRLLPFGAGPQGGAGGYPTLC
jgi:hypothetical protein